MKNNYPQIKKLGLTVHENPYPHVRGKELDAALKKRGIKEKFNEYFGIQTCLALEDGETGVYPWDIEAVLARIFENKLTGTQLLWD